jgi:PEP-CTERM motif-containing protein
VGYSRIRSFTITSTVIIAGGFLAVRASPDCVRFVHTYITVPVRNRVSKATAKAWAEWRIAHPDWKPNPKVQRPKYVMTRKEAIEKVEFACSMPTEPQYLDLLLAPEDLSPPPPFIELPPMEATQITIPAPTPPDVIEAPPEVATEEWPPLVPYVPPIVESGGASPVFPVLPVVPPPIVGAVPEPSSLVLVAIGLASTWLLAGTRLRRANMKRI